MTRDPRRLPAPGAIIPAPLLAAYLRNGYQGPLHELLRRRLPDVLPPFPDGPNSVIGRDAAHKKTGAMKRDPQDFRRKSHDRSSFTRMEDFTRGGKYRRFNVGESGLDGAPTDLPSADALASLAQEGPGLPLRLPSPEALPASPPPFERGFGRAG